MISKVCVTGKTCRSCLSENDDLRSVFEANDSSGDSVQIAVMMMACASIQVVAGDGLPALICPACEGQLSSAYSFRQLCEKSDAALRQYLSENTTPDNDRLDIVVKPDIDIATLADEPDVSATESEHSNYSTSKKRRRPTRKSPRTAKFACKFCDKVLTTKDGLKLHERRHTGEKLKVCHVCNAEFAKTNHLIRHMSTHNKSPDQYTHVCPECGMGFTRAYHLLKHKKEHRDEEAAVAAVTATSAAIAAANAPSATSYDDNLAEYPSDEEEDDRFVDNNEDKTGNEEAEEEENNEAEGKGGTVEVAVAVEGNADARDSEDEENLSGDDRKNGAFSCDYCSKKMTTEAGLLIHMRRHTGDNLSVCKICDKSFTKTSHLNRHLLTHGMPSTKKERPKEKPSVPKEKKVLECEFCDRKFVYKKSFLHHIKVEHGVDEETEEAVGKVDDAKDEAVEAETDSLFMGGDSASSVEYIEAAFSNPNDANDASNSIMAKEEESTAVAEDIVDDETDESKKIHVCHVCNHKFSRPNHLTRHMTLHRAILTEKCLKCEKAFSTKEHLEKHDREYHVDKPYVCTTCDRPFSRGEHLIRHLKIHNKGKEEHKCSICDRVFTRSDHLARHTKIHLAQDKRHICSECGKSFNRLDNLRTHSRVHTGLRDPQRLHLCIYCGKEFNNSSNMIVHMRRHTGERPYKCQQCGKGFPRSHDLKCHERVHSGEKPYLCTLCGKSFNKSNKLLRHTRVHTGERPYVCNLCGRAFTQSNDLALHMRRHTGSRPYACAMCPARFIQSGQLKMHRRSTGHWLETTPELKGAHRVAPVTPIAEPTPIKFKTRVNKVVCEPQIINIIGNIEEKAELSEDERGKLLRSALEGGRAAFVAAAVEANHIEDAEIEIKFNVEGEEGAPGAAGGIVIAQQQPQAEEATAAVAYQDQGEAVQETYTVDMSSSPTTFAAPADSFNYQTYG